jgi:cyclic pyranopterin phosphate synthase
VKVNAVVKRGANDDEHRPLAEHFRGSGHVLRFIEYMDVGSHERLAPRGRRQRDEIVRRISDAGRSSRWQPAARRDRAPLPLPRRRGRDRRRRVRHAAVLRRLLPRPPLCRGTALHLPLSPLAATICARRCASGLRRGARRATPLIWTRRTDRYSELRTAETALLPKVEMSYIGG